MSAQNNGGPAFPTSHSPDYPNEIGGGASMRDYFAAKAMQAGMAMKYPLGDLGYSMKNSKSIMENYAIFAYEMADAMLAAREAK